MTNEQSDMGGDAGVLLRADDGAMYLVPLAALEGYRLPEEQRAAVEAGLPADGDVQGFYIGTFGFAPMSRDKIRVLAVLNPRHSSYDYHPPLR